MNAILDEMEGALVPSIDQAEQAALFAVGHMLYERGDYEKAADVLRFLVLAVPLDAPAWWALGSCCEQLEDLEGAAAMYGNAVRLGEEDPLPALLCARALIRLNEREEASAVLRELDESKLCSTNRARYHALRNELGERR